MSGFPTFVSTFHSHCRGEVEAEPGALEATLAECLSAGQAGWPTLPLPPLDFIAHLAQRGAATGG